MYKDNRISVTVCQSREDRIRQMELFCGRDGHNPWRKTVIQFLLILLCAAGAVYGAISRSGDMLIVFGVLTLFCLPAVISSAVVTGKVQKEKLRLFEEEKQRSPEEDEPVSVSFCFGREYIFFRDELWDRAMSYENFSRIVEYSDGLFFEAEFESESLCCFIPARFLSAQMAAEIIARIKRKFRRYTCVSQLRTVDPPQSAAPEEGLFDLSKHKLLCEAEYTLTPVEIRKASSVKTCYLTARKLINKGILLCGILLLFFLAFAVFIISIDRSEDGWGLAALFVGLVILIAGMYLFGGFLSPAKRQGKYLETEAGHGSRIALFENFACVSIWGDDLLIMYHWLSDALRTPEFICVRNAVFGNQGKWARVYHVIPLRALENADEFIRVLEERIQAARAGEISLTKKDRAVGAGLSDTEPLREDDSKGKNILSARYGEMNVSIRRKFRVTELIINGGVYAEKKELVQGPYCLSAVVDGVEFTAQQHVDGTVQLFAQGLQIASGIHKI